MKDKIKNTTKKAGNKTNEVITKRPILSLLIGLVILFILIFVSNKINEPEVVEQSEPTAKKVTTYNIGQAPTVEIGANIDNSNVVSIFAQSGGVINQIYKTEGENINMGEWVAFIGSNYSGANAGSLQRQIAQKQYENISETIDDQLVLIEKQIQIVERQDAFADDNKEIAEKSLEETNDLIDINNDIIETLEDNLESLEKSNSNGSNDALILSTKQLLSQFTAANNQAKSASRASELQINGSDNSKLASLNKDVSIKQLEIQAKSLKLSEEISKLQLQLARVTESLNYPTSPVTGTIEKIHVRNNQLVSPGTLLATISSNGQGIRVIGLITKDIANSVSLTQPSQILIEDKIIDATPSYISTQPTNGSLYSVFFDLTPEQTQSLNIADSSFVRVFVPVGYADTTSNLTYIPIDAVHQTQDKSFIYIFEEGQAITKEVTLGNVTGNFVEILEGVSSSDQIIIERNVVDKDRVEVIN